MDVAHYLIARLKDAGLEHIFAVPGDYASPFLEAVDATEGLERVGTITEMGSGYSADGYARFKGIGAACVQYGVGTLSTLNCAAGAFVERVPIVFVSASPSKDDRTLERTKGILFHHSTGDLELNRRLYESVTVASESISNATDAPSKIDRAIRALLARRRPIFIEVWQNVWKEDCHAPRGVLKPESSSSSPDALTAFAEAAWKLLQSAHNPIVWAGVQIKRYALQVELLALIEASGVPFTTTSLGKTVLDERHPLFVGTYAGAASLEITRDAMAEADCVLALGDIITDDYLDIMAAKYEQMISVDDVGARVGQAHYRDVTMKDALRELTARTKSDRTFPKLRRSLKSSDPRVPDPTDRLSYTIFCFELYRFLHQSGLLSNVVLILGESTSLYVFGNLSGLPKDSFVAQAAWGSLGHETGSALGIALASQKRPFVIAGDGGFMMMCQELSSLCRAKVNGVIFVMSNRCYAIEQAFVDITAFSPQGAFASFDELPHWDYQHLASAFGAIGYRAETVAELRDILLKIATLDGVLALVEIIIQEKDLPPQLARLASAPTKLRKYGRAA